jgi:hypothetical protein
MQTYVHSGYYGIFRPPHSLESTYHRSTIYCVSDRFNISLVIIPLVPAFYKDVIDIVRKHKARHIYLIAGDIGVAFASDYYLAWDTITNVLRRKCQIFSKYMIENYSRADFKSDIIRTENDNISIEVPRSNNDVGTIDITLTKAFVHGAAPFSCDIILNDTLKKRLFIGEMNKHKACYLNEHRDEYDEIHMPFITGNYAGMTYNALLKSYPALVSKIICNQFASDEEYEYAKSRGVHIGGAVDNDSI